MRTNIYDSLLSYEAAVCWMIIWDAPCRWQAESEVGVGVILIVTCHVIASWSQTCSAGGQVWPWEYLAAPLVSVSLPTVCHHDPVHSCSLRWVRSLPESSNHISCHFLQCKNVYCFMILFNWDSKNRLLLTNGIWIVKYSKCV